MPLRLRLALFGASVMALGLALFGALVYLLAAHSVVADQDRALRQHAMDAVTALQAVPAADLQPRAVPTAVDLRTSPDVFLEVRGADGSVISSTGELDGRPPAVAASLLQRATANGGAYATVGDQPATRLRLYALPWRRTIDGRTGFLVAGQTRRVPAASLGGLVGFLIISAIPSLLAALLASWLVAGRALRPLRQVAGEADQVGRTRDFARRLPHRGGRDEIALLTTSFNRMLDQLHEAYHRLAAALDGQRRFVADASHELRTPLTTIQGNAGLLAFGPPQPPEVRADAAHDIAAESDRMARLVERLLVLAGADAGLRLELTQVDLAGLVREVCRQAAGRYPRLRLHDEVAMAWVAGDSDTLRQLLWILLDNAARHARTSAAVALAVEAGWARLSVADDGPGIPAEDQERVFERFYRADRSRGGDGAGLGLSIARWITDQHGGRILAAHGADGGAVFYVDIPIIHASLRRS
jgi:two-component system OmpR family sensor kinase